MASDDKSEKPDVAEQAERIESDPTKPDGKTLVLRSPDHDFQSMGCDELEINLELLCGHVVKAAGRIEVEMPCDCGGNVVLISKAELDALEAALRIYAESHRDHANDVREALVYLADRLEDDTNEVARKAV